MEFQPGVLIGDRYRVERVLSAREGETVLATRGAESSAVVAVKVFPTSTASAHVIQRFSRAQAIDSPHVPALFDLGSLDDRRTFIAMEYLEGETLKSRVGRGPLPIASAVEAMLHACHAIGAAHQIGVVHRRLTTSKLFQTQSAHGASATRVLGFVTSALAGEEKPGELPHGVDYLAPEQLTGVRNGERSADLWALGVIFYELLTGRLPFAAITEKAVAKRILGDEPRRPRAVRKDLPWQLEQVILRCLAKAPTARIESIAALVKDLEPFSSTAIAVSSDKRLAIKATLASRVEDDAAQDRLELPHVTKLHHLRPGTTDSGTHALPAFHKLRSDGRIEGLAVDDMAQMVRKRRVEAGGPVENAVSVPPPRMVTKRSGRDTIRWIIAALIVMAVVLGVGTGLLVRYLRP